MGHTIEVFIVPVLLRIVIVTIIGGLRFILSVRNAGSAESNPETHDVSRLPLRAATCAGSSCGIVHEGILVVIDDMSELALEYLRSSLHYIWVLLQRRAGLGYGSTLLCSDSVNPTTQYFWPGCRRTISTS